MNRYEVTIEDTVRIKAIVVVEQADSEQDANEKAALELKYCLGAAQQLLMACKEARAALKMLRCGCSKPKRQDGFRCVRCQALRIVREAIDAANPNR